MLQPQSAQVVKFPYRDRFVHGDCIEVMDEEIATESIDFILTDPPFLMDYTPRDGRKLKNDTDHSWLKPAYEQMYRVLKRDSFCLSFYGSIKANLFLNAFVEAGFSIKGNIVFVKKYSSSAKYLKYQHESAFLLAKGRPPKPNVLIGDVHHFEYTENRHHPCEKFPAMLEPFIEAFCPLAGIVLDPFAGSGSTLLAARNVGRYYFGVELHEDYYAITKERLN